MISSMIVAESGFLMTSTICLPSPVISAQIISAAEGDDGLVCARGLIERMAEQAQPFTHVPIPETGRLLDDIIDFARQYVVLPGEAETVAVALQRANVKAVLDQMSINWDMSVEREAAYGSSEHNAKIFWRWLMDPKQVSDEEIAAVRAAGFSDGDIVAIAGLTAQALQTNFLNNIAQVELDFPADVPALRDTHIREHAHVQG